jgi:putative NADH-flavin reductase
MRETPPGVVRMMRTVIFGAGGTTGSAAVAEATARGHRVTSLSSTQADITAPERR